MDSPNQILEEARELGFYARPNINMSREEFNICCRSLGTPWTKELHTLHTEGFDEDNIVNWSNKTRFNGHSLPWHADNPWHSEYKFPLRAFWAETISHPNDIGYYLHITNWFESQDLATKEYFRSLKVLVQDYKNGCQPYWTSFVKKHPVTGKESFNWGAMALSTDVFGLCADEGLRFPHLSYTMAIQKDTRELISHEEIASWFQDMINNNHMTSHHWQEKDFVLMDNWVSLHYIGSTNYTEDRLLWRKTICQPWQKITG